MNKKYGVYLIKSTLNYYGSIKKYAETLGITNKLCGWVYLLDSNGKIRWQANGNSTQSEIDDLIKFTEELKGKTK